MALVLQLQTRDDGDGYGEMRFKCEGVDWSDWTPICTGMKLTVSFPEDDAYRPSLKDIIVTAVFIVGVGTLAHMAFTGLQWLWKS